NPEQSTLRDRGGRRYGEAVRAGRVAVGVGRVAAVRCDAEYAGRSLPRRTTTIEALELAQRHGLDVAADASFGERQRHPRLEPPDDARRHGGMRGEVVVESIRP